MSVDLDWSKMDQAMADKVRDILNDRFQTMSLPSMLKSIQVLSFEFGSIAPTIELQHITDPYPEFYQDNYDDDDDDDQPPEAANDTDSHPSSDPPEYASRAYRHSPRVPSNSDPRPRPTSYVDAWTPPFFPQNIGGGRPFPPFFHPTPGIMSGISTPTWAARAQDAESVHSQTTRGLSPESSTIGLFRPRSDTIDTTTSPPRLTTRPLDSFSRPTTAQSTGPEQSQTSDNDIQIIARIHYEGNPRAYIQAELDFNYPSSSFISLPVRLTLTGLSFSGLALIASIRNRVHFCFLDEDTDDDNWEHILRDIHLESEIGEKGKGVLKNVGKVERFLLEQGRKIISEELIFPSFYTFIL